MEELKKTEVNCSRDVFQKTPLMIACRHGQEDVVRTQVEMSCCNLDAIEENGWTSLMIASMNGHLGCVKALLFAGAELDFTDKEGKTSLDHAEAHPDIKQAITKEAERRAQLIAIVTGTYSAPTGLPGLPSGPSAGSKSSGGLPPELMALGLDPGEGKKSAGECPF